MNAYSYRLTYRLSASRRTSDSDSPRFAATSCARFQSASSARKLRSVVPRGISDAPARAARWMTAKEMTECVPPSYTEHIGRQLLAHIEQEAVA